MKVEHILFTVIAVALVAIACTSVAMVMAKDPPPVKEDNNIEQEMSDLAKELNADPHMYVYVGTTSYHAVNSKESTSSEYFNLATVNGVIVTYLGPTATGVKTVTEKASFSPYESGLIYISEVSTEYTIDAPIPDGYPANAIWLPVYKDTTNIAKKYIPYDSISRVVTEKPLITTVSP